MCFAMLLVVVNYNNPGHETSGTLIMSIKGLKAAPTREKQGRAVTEIVYRLTDVAERNTYQFLLM